jgi:hypothetical protein
MMITEYAHQFSAMKRSRFIDWTREELLELVILNDYEIRDEHNVSTVSLRDWCDEFYQNEKYIPSKPKLMTPAEKERADYLVRKFQNAWIIRQHHKRLEAERIALEAEIRESYRNFDYDTEMFDVDELGLQFGDTSNISDDHIDAIASLDETLRGLDELGNLASKSLSFRGDTKEDEAVELALKQSLRREPSSKVVAKNYQLLDSAWETPDWEQAERSKDYTHPRRGGKGGAMYDYRETTTGKD